MTNEYFEQVTIKFIINHHYSISLSFRFSIGDYKNLLKSHLTTSKTIYSGESKLRPVVLFSFSIITTIYSFVFQLSNHSHFPNLNNPIFDFFSTIIFKYPLYFNFDFHNHTPHHTPHYSYSFLLPPKRIEPYDDIHHTVLCA